MSSIATLKRCGDIQREIFFSNFLHHNKVGEMTCVNDEGSGDTFLFERWRIHGVDFVACFRLLSEDSLITHDISFAYRPHEELLAIKSERQLQLYTEFVEKLRAEGKTVEEVKAKAVAQGKDPTLFDYSPYTREMLEEKLPAGKKTIMGDRNTVIEVLERQQEIPNDLQRPRLNRYFLEVDATIKSLMALSEDVEEDVLESQCKEWIERFLVNAPRGINLRTVVPFLRETIEIVPTIYEFPAKELNV